MKKIFLVGNPKAGLARLKAELLTIVTVLTHGGYDVTVYPTRSKGDAAEVTAKLSDEYEMIVCCGGDGTLNEVINGIMKNSNNFRLGYIPLGTLNEWSSNLNISRNPKKAAQDILDGQSLALDIGKFGDRYFVYTASFGALTAASYSASQDVKNVIGPTAYFFEGLKNITSIKPIDLEVEINGETLSGRYLFGSVSNSLSMGGIIKLDKKTVLFDDGLFEVLLIENPDNFADFQKIVDSVIKRDYSCKQIRQFKTNKVTLRSGDAMSWTLDGEFAKAGEEITIENINKAIDFIIPKK